MTELTTDAEMMTDEQLQEKRKAMQRQLLRAMNDIHVAHQSNHALSTWVMIDVLSIVGVAFLDRPDADVMGVTPEQRAQWLKEKTTLMNRFWQSHVDGTVEAEIAAHEAGMPLVYGPEQRGRRH